MYTGNASDSNATDTISFSLIKNLIPITATTSEIDYADLGANGWKYILGVSSEDGLFFVVPNPVIKSSVQTGSFRSFK
jgi:hypothetical protein